MAASVAEVRLSEPSLPDADDKRRLPVLSVAALLEAQHTLTAVERFARKHDSGDVPAQAKYYKDLLPIERPRAGEQYAFEVDLDACTGCKACVAACHSLNGLDEDEMWRSVGFLHGGTAEAPAQQTVTTSCHHCLDPACMKGCPVQAYEKDPVTGIVKHLDDQCFGCQYCTLMCPYDAPKYNARRGIVRKCDMCSVRLSHGEAPACVQACPNKAIAIRVVEQAAVVQTSEAQRFLPGAPAPDHTLPATQYKSRKALPSNLLPADFYTTSPEYSHPPLVIMLVLTQLAVGAFGVGLLVERLSGRAWGSPLFQTTFACALALVALGASVFHLGRPWLAYRAVLGLRTSWLSREAVAFGLFAKLAVLYGVLTAAPMLPDFPLKSELVALSPGLHVTAALFGALGVFCSVMVYVATQRAQWSGTHTGIRFFGTTALLGAASVLTVGAATTSVTVRVGPVTPLLWVILGVAALKLAFETRILLHVRDKQQTVMKRMGTLLSGDLREATALRLGLGAAGGVAVPALLLSGVFAESTLVPLSAILVLLVASELAERYLYFRAAPAPRMPGGIR